VAQGPANISSPDVIKRFRSHFVKFDETCRNALESIHSDVGRVQDWLRREQATHWKHQLRKREDMVEKARREYMQARHDRGPTRKQSCVDEKKALERAMKLKEEAEEKLRAVKKWTMTIDHKAGKALGPCVSLSSTLSKLTPKALARLDQMLDSLDDYLRPGAAVPGA
jgi:hypothetical protein